MEVKNDINMDKSDERFFSVYKQDSWTICRIFKKTSSMAQQGLLHSWGHPFPGATEAEMFSAFHTVQASELALESSSCSLPSAPSSLFTSWHGLQGQQSNLSVEGSSCKLINFNCNQSLESQNCPIIFPFVLPTSQKAAGLPLVFGAPPDQ
jgi:hypothetical protein